MKQMLKYILSLVMENVKIAENKHGLILALNSGLIVVTVGFFNSHFLIVIILNLFVLIFCGISILFCFLGLFARHVNFKKKNKIKGDLNLLYYKDIAEFGIIDYLKCIIINYNFPLDYKIDNFEEDLSKQIIVNSKIATKKFMFFNLSIAFLVAGLVLSVFLMAIVGFFYGV